MSRIEQARRNVRITRYAIGVTAAAGLGAFAAAARSSHPATHTTPSGSSAATAAATDDSSSSGFFESDDGGSYVAPSYGQAPQVQSGGS